MKSSSISAALSSIALIALPCAGLAQTATLLKPVSVGIAAGASFPVSDLGNIASTGYNLTGTLALNPATLPIGFRFDGAYNQFSAKAPTTVNSKIASVTGNVLYNMAAGTTATPYLIGGGGWYRVSSTISGGSATSGFGFNAGAGINLPLTGFSTFIEARFNHVSVSGRSTSYIPVTVGVLF